jgi:hypothetical protein
MNHKNNLENFIFDFQLITILICNLIYSIPHIFNEYSIKMYNDTKYKNFLLKTLNIMH